MQASYRARPVHYRRDALHLLRTRNCGVRAFGTKNTSEKSDYGNGVSKTPEVHGHPPPLQSSACTQTCCFVASALRNVSYRLSKLASENWEWTPQAESVEPFEHMNWV